MKRLLMRAPGLCCAFGGAGSRCAPLSCAELYADRIRLKSATFFPGYLDMLIAKTKKAVWDGTGAKQ